MKKHYLWLLFFLSIGITSCSNEKFETEDSGNSDPLTKSAALSTTVFEDGSELLTFPNGFTVLKRDTLYIWQGDIILTQKQVDIFSQQRQTRSTVIMDAIKYWPHRKVYYTFGSNYASKSETQQAMAQWESQSGIKFYPKTSSNPDYIEFVNIDGEASYSSLGMIGGKQNIQIVTNQPIAKVGNIIHEIGHALGLEHEHCRIDRDNYIVVNLNNVRSNFRSAYDINRGGMDVGTFDFNSIMLYDSWSFGINVGGVTQVTMVKKSDNSTFIGQRNYLSSGDIEGVSAMYGPPYAKLVRSFYDSYDNSDQQRDDYGTTYTNYIYFYSDLTYKTLQATKYPRKIHLIHQIEDGCNARPVNYDVVVTVPAGVTSYNVGTTSMESFAEFGYCKNWYYDSYQLEND